MKETRARPDGGRWLGWVVVGGVLFPLLVLTILGQAVGAGLLLWGLVGLVLSHPLPVALVLVPWGLLMWSFHRAEERERHRGLTA